MKKILSVEELPVYISELNSLGKSIVLVGGVFDVLHLGHITFLKEAAKLGDILLVMIESDEGVVRRKGPHRPLHPQRDRALVLASVEGVDGIILLPFFERDDDYSELVKQVRPDIIGISEGDTRRYVDPQAQMVGAKVVVVTPKIDGHSTTELIKNITR